MKKIAICMMLIMALMCCSLALAEELAVTRLPQDAAVQPADGVYVLDQSGSYAAYGTTMDVRIEVAADVTLILSGAQISLSEEDAAPISVRPGARLTLVVADGTVNALHAGDGAAGVQVETGSTLIIRCQSGAGHVCTDACGFLDVKGGDAPQEEIVPDEEQPSGGGSMNGPPQNVYEAAAGAGIGGGAGKSSGTISIESGRIAARGGSSDNITGGAPGVGGGGNTETPESIAHSGAITISGGMLQAEGAVGAAGIGGGDWGGEGRDISILGGVIIARGGDGASGIGGGFLGEGKNIRISCGNVAAYGGEEASGIGGGYAADGRQIVISGGRVQAHAGAQYVYPGKKHFINDAIGSGAEAKNADFCVGPGVAVYAGSSRQEAVQLPGSPFAASTPLAAETDDAGYVETLGANADQWYAGGFYPQPGEAGQGGYGNAASLARAVPLTGDEAHPMLWLALALLSAAVLLLMSRKKALKP